MRHLLTALALTALLTAPALDAEAAPKKKRKPNAAQQRMKDCNAKAKAKGLKGPARKAFMSRCLKAPGKAGKGAGAAKKPNAAQQRMKDCNAKAKAKGLKGPARKAFMSQCLKKK